MIFYSGISQSLSRDQISSLSQKQFPKAIETYREFLSIPNNGNFPEETAMNVAWCMKTFKRLGFQAQIIQSKGVPHVYAEKKSKKSDRSILFYLQIDGQPVDTSAWNQESPFKAVLKTLKDGKWETIGWERLESDYSPDYRVFARSASDSKGPAIAFLSAIEIMKNENIEADFTIKVIADFQEEMGSRTLPELVLANKELFDAEMMLIMDGTRHISNLPTLTFGARGIATITLKVFGATRNLHSGQYGNYAPNPVFKLAKLIGAMKDEEGRVTIPGFYEGVNLSERDLELLNDVPEDQEEIQRSLGIAGPDSVGSTYQESLQYPSLNVRGLRAAWTGKEVRTLIPAEAVAEIDMRLVPETDGLRQVSLVRNFIEEQGFHMVDSIPSEEERRQYSKLISFNYRLGSKPFRTELSSPIGDWLSSAMERTFGDQFVKMRATGGSQPIAPFITTLNLPAVSVRIPNPDNNIHAPNENLRVGNFLEGIQMCLGVLTQKLN